jgi:hypothetical protein
VPPDPIACLFCGCEQLSSPDDPPGLGSIIICGNCCALHVLDAAMHSWDLVDTWVPFLRRLTQLERLEVLHDAKVKAFLDAFQLASIEDRMKANKDKGKPLSPVGRKIRHGDLLRFEAKGPDAR